MEINVTQLLVTGATQIADFFEGSFLIAALKFFLFVYTFVLLADVIMLLILRGVSYDLKKMRFGTPNLPLIPKSATTKKWEAILSRLESENPSQYKVALLEADAMAEEVLMGMGYSGENMAEKLESVGAGHLETRDLLKEAHEIRNRVVHEENFVISREETERWLQSYHKFFEELELF